MNSERVILNPDKDFKTGKFTSLVTCNLNPSPVFLNWQQNREGKHIKDLVSKIIAPIRTCWDTANIWWGTVFCTGIVQRAVKLCYLLWSLSTTRNSSSSHNTNS